MNSDSLGGMIIKFGVWLVACILLPWVVIPVTLIYFAFKDGRKVGRYEEQQRNNRESQDGFAERTPIEVALEMVRGSHASPEAKVNQASVDTALSRLRRGIEALYEEAGLGQSWDGLDNPYVSERILVMLEVSDDPEELVEVILEEATADMVQEGLIVDPGQHRLNELLAEPEPHGPPVVTESDDPQVRECMASLYAGMWVLYKQAGLDPRLAPQTTPKARQDAANLLAECEDPVTLVNEVLDQMVKDMTADGLIEPE